MKLNRSNLSKIGVVIVIIFISIFTYKYNQFTKKPKDNLISNDPLTSLWQTNTDTSTGITIKYPEDIDTKYINPVEWPPKVLIVDEPFNCMEIGGEINNTGKTEKKIINGHNYCVTTMIEGAAGSMYINSIYLFQKDEKIFNMAFTLRAVQCANYDEPKKTECEKERSIFYIDDIIDHIAQSLVLN